MIFKIGNNPEPDRLYLGNSAVSKIYLGNNQVWPVSSAVSSLALPLIAGPQQDGDTATVDTSALTDVTSIQWRVFGGGNLGTGATQDLTGLGDQYVEVITQSAEGTLTSPAIAVYAPMMDPSHSAMDAALLAVVPHNAATKIAINNGDWSNPATWTDGSIPQAADVVLIPYNVSVRYDVDAPSTFIAQLRVDGVFSFATNVTTHLYIRDFFGTRGSIINIGNSVVDRVDATVQAMVTFEGSTALDVVSDPELFGRGLVTSGALNIFGAEKLNHSRAAFGESAGRTSIVLEETPVGWENGDQIVIGATSAKLPFGLGIGMADTAEDEIVTITNVSGNTVSFTPALTYSHENQSSEVSRTDIRPMVQLRAASRNVILQSEVTAPVTQRGHIMVMHMYGRMDIWDVGLVEMGRTSKAEATPVGIRDTDGSFRYHDGTSIQNVPFTADANIIGRYPIHAHKMGYSHLAAGRPMPLLQNATIEASPGWGGVHHDCEMNMIASSTFRVFGCGFVAEQGGELGAWDDLSAMQSTAVNMRGSDVFLKGSPKGQHNTAALAGDYFNYGYGFGYRGRSVKVTRCVATSCSWGHVFYHRATSNPDDYIFPTTNPPRDRMDLKEVGLFNSSIFVDEDQWRTNDYPIVHFADCGSIACISGVFVTKQAPQQAHDFNVIWKDFFSHGYRNIGAEIEYVGTYILQDLDIVAGAERIGDGTGQIGIVIGNNTYQIALVRPRTEGAYNTGIRLSGATVGEAVADDFDAATDPRFWVIGAESINEPTPLLYVNEGTKTLDQVAVVRDDFDLAYIDYSLIPTETFPDVVGTWSGTNTGTTVNPPTNADGLKFGNHPVGLPISTKTWSDSPFEVGALQIIRNANRDGYSQFNGNDVLVQRELISDVLTGRPAKFTALWQADNPVTFGVDNGPIVISPAVTAPDVLAAVAPGGSYTFNALAGATGGSGSFEIDPGDFVAPDYGDLDINYATGMVTYTPRPEVSNQSDYGYISIRSVQDTGATKTETRTYATKRIGFLITNSATMNAPVHTTHYNYSTLVAQDEFEINLLQQPDSGGRRILAVQYSTDSGVTWRRLCNGYPLGPITVNVNSQGAALSPGSTVRLRYFTDHEYGYSPETGDVTAVAGTPV